MAASFEMLRQDAVRSRSVLKPEIQPAVHQTYNLSFIQMKQSNVINMKTKGVDDDTTASSSDGREAGGDLPIAVAVAEAIPDTDEEARTVALAAQEEATASIREHCESHLSLNPASSYVSWIATREFILLLVCAEW